MAVPTSAAPASADPQAAIQKYASITQKSAEADKATITRIEAQIRNSPMGWLAGVQGEVNARASSEKGQVDGKLAEHASLAEEHADEAPPDAGPAPRPGPPARPAVPAPSSAKATTGKEKAPAPRRGSAARAAPKRVSAKSVAKSGARGQATPGALGQRLAGAGNDFELAAMLNAYQPRNQQPMEMLARIKQMRHIAEGFNGQLETYVSRGSQLENVIAGAANFFGVGRDASAVWSTNPYRQVQGSLGTLMVATSAVKSAAGAIGSICGKIGMILTVIGLLAMIFGPIGVAVSAIARVLNVVGLICDAISLVMAGVLTGLNGVVLAQQIAAGGSAEEKAATADLMISEANSAAGSFTNLVMMFGGGFMRGLQSASRGVIGSLIRRFRGVVGRVSLRLTGGARNFANRIVRRMGLGGVNANRVRGQWVATTPGLMSRVGSAAGRVWRSAPAKIDAWGNAAMTRLGNSGFGKWLDRRSARMAAWADKWDIDKRLGNLGERAGRRVGYAGTGSRFELANEAFERETREIAMRQAQQDAMHLERTRWERRYANDPAMLRRQQTMIGRRVDRVREDHQKKFDTKESTFVRDRNATDRARRQQRNEDTEHSDRYQRDAGYRESTMRDLHRSREHRWRLENDPTTRALDTQRKELQELTRRTPSQQRRLDALNTRLAPLDRRRTRNIELETQQQRLAGTKAREVHNWGDVASNVHEAVDPFLEMVGIKEQRAAWRNTEKGSLAKSLQRDAKAASKKADGLAGRKDYGVIREEAARRERQEFAAFIAKSRPTGTVAQTVRSMLSGVNRAPAAPTSAPSAPAAAQTPAPRTTAPAAAPTPSAPASSTASAAPVAALANAPAAATPAPTNAPAAATPAQTSAPASAAPQSAQQATGLPDPVQPAPDAEAGGGAEPLPYWPALIPEFDSAMQDFAFMRRVATEFKRAQIAGKQKAVDTLAVFGRYQEYAQLRQQQAAQHQGESQQTQAGVQTNVGAANQSAAQAGQGAARQDQARGQANNRAAVDLPEPETRSWWDRIFGAVKRWAKNKAAEVFGWIQGQIAGAILRVLCNVSMTDMKDYASALRNQQAASAQVAGTAIQQSGQAQQRNIQLGQGAATEAQSAANSIGECDQNILEADGFIANVTEFEQQLTAEKAHALKFLGDVRAAVHVEQERRRQAEQQAQQQAQQQAAQQGPGQEAGPGETSAEPASAEPQGPADADGDGVPDDAEADAARTQILAASNYIVDAANNMKIQLQGRADDYANELQLVRTNRTGDDAQGNDLLGPARRGSRQIVESFQQVVDATRQSLAGFRDTSQIDPSSAGQIADHVISTAESLDAQYDQSLHALDDLFERTYNGIREGRRDITTRVLAGDNIIGRTNDAMDDATDAVAGTVANTSSAVWGAMTGSDEPAESVS